VVAGLAFVALWRVGPPPIEPVTATTGAPVATLEKVEVREVVSPRAFWVGTTDAERTLAVLDPDVKRIGTSEIASGRRVTLVGLVRPAPDPGQAVRQWNVDAATASSVHERGTYLYVTEIRP
jgi:hypothetical protein